MSGTGPSATSDKHLEWASQFTGVALRAPGKAPQDAPGGGAAPAGAKGAAPGGPKGAAPPKGSRKVNVQITFTDWNGAPFRGYEGILEFKSPGTDPVTVGGEIKGGVLDFAGLSLMPQGTLRVMTISKGKASIVPEGVTTYKLPDKGLTSFAAVQGRKVLKATAKSSREAADKVGAKGNVGVDYKVFTASGEVSAESESRQGSEVSIEYEILQGTDAFDLKQA